MGETSDTVRASGRVSVAHLACQNRRSRLTVKSGAVGDDTDAHTKHSSAGTESCDVTSGSDLDDDTESDKGAGAEKTTTSTSVVTKEGGAEGAKEFTNLHRRGENGAL